MTAGVESFMEVNGGDLQCASEGQAEAGPGTAHPVQREGRESCWVQMFRKHSFFFFSEMRHEVIS